MSKWYDGTGGNSDVVVSTRLRLARNIEGYKFASTIEEEEARELVNKIVSKFQMDYDDTYTYLFMNNCTEAKRNALKARRIISSHMITSEQSAAILSKDESVSVLVNAEDHIRIQALATGMNMNECYQKADEIDDYIDSNFYYAFDEQYGFKTSFLTNVGTGLRASYTLHLPALTEAKRIANLTTEMARFGVKMKMLYGDREGGYGALYQISSQKTLGQSEKEIIKNLDDIVMQVINQERIQRNKVYEADPYKAEDVAYKSYGILKYARKLSLKDALSLLSEIKLGIAMNILSIKEPKISYNQILMEIQPAVIGNTSTKALTVKDIDVLRAQYIRNNMPDLE